jgi:hypothetical protein
MSELCDLEIYNPVKTQGDIYYSKVMLNGGELTIQTNKNKLKLNKDKMKCVLNIDESTSEVIKRVSTEVIKNTAKRSKVWFAKEISESDCESIYKEAATPDKLYCFYDENTQFYTSKNSDIKMEELEDELDGIALLKCNAVIYTKTSFFIRWEVSQFKIKREKSKEFFNDYMIIDLQEHSMPLEVNTLDNIESKLENITLF